MANHAGPMACPVDGATLVMSERSGIEIDYCPTCRGVWLDRGELDKIIERNAASRAPQPAAPPQQQQAPQSGRSVGEATAAIWPWIWPQAEQKSQVVPGRPVRLGSSRSWRVALSGSSKKASSASANRGSPDAFSNRVRLDRSFIASTSPRISAAFFLPAQPSMASNALAIAVAKSGCARKARASCSERIA